MKKLLLFLSIGTIIFATQSCKKPPLPIIVPSETIDTSGNGGGGEVEVNPYVGTWTYTNIDLKDGILAVMGNDVGTFTGKGSKIVGEVIITENPNIYTTEVAFTADVDAVFGGQTQTQNIPIDKQSSSGTWTESNGEISLEDDNGHSIGIISSSSSKVVFTGNFAAEIPSQFFTIDATSDVEFTIIK